MNPTKKAAIEALHSEVIAVISVLMDGDPAHDSPADKALKLLADAAVAYERVFYPMGSVDHDMALDPRSGNRHCVKCGLGELSAKSKSCQTDSLLPLPQPTGERE